MRAIFYAGLLAAAALFTMSCKQNDQTKPDDDKDTEVSIFKVESKPAVETSAEDAAWVTCDTKQDETSPHFIQTYIYGFNEFSCRFTHPILWGENEMHGDGTTGMPVPPEDSYWVESNFDASKFRISFQANYQHNQLVSGDKSHYFVFASRKINIFNKIAKQNNDVNYNGYHWNPFGAHSYIPTEFVNIECVQNYDAAHPAGMLLNDIAVIDYYSAETFIRSGYKNNRAMDYCKFADKGRLPEPLNEFNKKQVNMISGLSFMVSLTQAPDVEGVYTFKLTYKDISGETRTATTIPIRLAAK